MIKSAYCNSIAKKAEINHTIQPGVMQKLWRGLTSSSTGSKITRAVLAGLPAAAIAKLLGAGWGASAAIGAGSAGAAWYAPKLSKKYRLQQAARDKGVPSQLLDMVHYLDTDLLGDNPMDTVRANFPYNVSQDIRKVRDLLKKDPLNPQAIETSVLAQVHRNQMLPEIRKKYPMPNTDRLLAQLRGLGLQDIVGPQNTGKAEALAQLIRYR